MWKMYLALNFLVCAAAFFVFMFWLPQKNIIEVILLSYALGYALGNSLAALLPSRWF